MLPLRMLGLLLLCLPLCDAGNTCPLSLNPLIVVDPPVVEFGDHVYVNCSTEEEFEEITLMLGNTQTKNEEFDNVAFSFAKMTDWDMKSECKIKLNNSFECSKELDIILYQIPEVHLFITETKTLGEETNYKLQCYVCDVAPAQNLTVRWYRSDEILDVQVYSETTKTPVNTSSMLVVNVTRDENAVEVRCEAQLELGPHGPQHPVVSQTLNLSALYAPEFRTNQSRHIIVNEGEDVSLTCEADGIPPPKYQWTINGIDALETSDTLKIINVNKSATYSCTASNKHGNVTVNVSVDVPEVTTTAAPAAMASPQALTPQEIPEVLFSIISTDVQGIVSRYLLQCVVVGATPAENILVKWYKNDVIIKSVHEPARTPVNTSSMLVVNVTRDENAVEVRCEAQLELGPHGPQHPVVSQTLNLSALYAPEFRTNQSRHIIVNEGEDVSLTCEADGIPPPKYQWTINGIDALETSDTLKIINVNKSATYSCTASNKHGNVTVNVSVDVPEVITTAAPAAMASPQALTPQGCSITVTPPEVVVKFGDPVAINCSTAATTTFRMGWEYSAGKATVNNSYAFWKIDKLEDWTLQPICYVYPDIGSPCIETASIILYQTPDLVSVSALEDGPMEAGSTYRLKCDIYNVAPAHNLSVKWYRDNTTLYTDHITTYDVTPRNVTSSLTITPLRSDHRSLFRCKAELHLGPRGPELPPTAASAPFVATVLYAPEFKEGNISKELTPDRDVTFDCSAEGNPDPEIKWIYKPAHNLKETTEGRQKIITVTAATSTNAGFYICVATNKVGNVTRTVTLVMRGKTSSVFVYWLPILLLVIILLVGLYCLCHRRKKKGEYSFVSDSDKSSIPMTGSAAGKSQEGNQNNL
ncbi:vascular cell adhesion protein 1 isoform X1 [Nothobranchius furzeri]|uniref:Vascular cell adhesion protein 1-like n=3 Tax=Nothobranchius TaxID=28779 RepID=A0A9D2YSP1_NOTFU|nr:vascular cell adhesion protein 1-like [Nothobranchius furzeri]